MSLLEAFAANLKTLRARRQLSQYDLADRAGVSVSYVSMLERGQRSPPLETIEKLATALRTSPQSLLVARA